MMRKLLEMRCLLVFLLVCLLTGPSAAIASEGEHVSESGSDKDTSGDFLIEDGVLKKYTGQEECVEIPEGVEEIARGAFYHNRPPKEIVLPKSLKKIQDEAFAYVDTLKKINVSEDVEVGKGAFFRCYGLTDEQGLVIINGVVHDGLNAGENGVLIFPEGITTIGTKALEENWGIRKVILSHSVKKIERRAFHLCSFLEEVELPEGLEIIEEEAFMDAGLSVIRIPDSVTFIGQRAFYDWGGHQELTLQGRTRSVTEAYATKYGVKFVPTNEQLLGDMDGNGVYEAEDALSILKMVVRLETVYGYSGDIDMDGGVSVEDALMVLRKVVGLTKSAF